MVVKKPLHTYKKHEYMSQQSMILIIKMHAYISWHSLRLSTCPLSISPPVVDLSLLENHQTGLPSLDSTITCMALSLSDSLEDELCIMHP